MRNVMALMLVVILVLLATGSVYARGGTDCPPGSTDPDCVAAASSGR